MKKKDFKFRAWQPNWDNLADYWKKYHPKMDYNYSIDSDSIEATHINNINEDRDAVIMQYIGMKDKNGKDIYELDIVKMSMPNGSTKEKIILVELIVDYNFGFCGYMLPMSSNKEIEVIGNIFETPELLPK